MNQLELEQLREKGGAPDLDQYNFATVDSFLVVNRKVAIPVYTIDSSLPDSYDLEIINENGDFIGMLCFCRKLGSVDPSELTEYSKVAYFSEVSKDLYHREFQFELDYVVIELQYLNDYVANMKSSSVIWGGFSHDTPLPQDKRNVSIIYAKSNICYPTIYHQKQAIHAVQTNHAFDRFLKFYHHLELLFDYVVVRRIQDLGEDLNGIAKMMSRYSAKDLPSLKELQREYCKDASKIWEVMKQVGKYETIAFRIFVEYGKEGNPLIVKWQDFIDSLKLSTYPPTKLGSKTISTENYEKLVIETSAYWLFRIRCCIAHNRIGEFVMTEAEIGFIVHFGEPLLKEIVVQVLSNPDLPKSKI